MSFIPTAAKRMKSVTHDQKLQRNPGRLKRLKAVRIIDLSGKVSDDAFDDVIGSRHARVKEMGTCVGNLFQEGCGIRFYELRIFLEKMVAPLKRAGLRQC